FCMRLEKSGEYYKLSICAQGDEDQWYSGRDIYITDDWQAVEFEWEAATAAGANDGYMKLWVNDALMDTISGIDSDASRITDVTLGLITSHPANINGSVYFDAFESRQGQHIGLDPNGPMTPPLTDLVFVDGFESGDFSSWGWATTGGGNLSASTQAAGIGQYGAQALVDSTNNMALYDSSPIDAKHINTRFYFDPNSVQITSRDGFYLFAESSSAGWVACLYFEQQGQYYSLTLCGDDDSGSWHENPPVLIADTWQAIEVEWKAATAPGANDGYVRLFIGDQLASSFENFDNDTQSITETSLLVDGDTSTGSGVVYFDGYKSVIGSHIGLDPNGPVVSAPPTKPDALFQDDFEGGNLSKWNPTLTAVDGGDLSVSANAAYQSSFGLQALIDDTTVIKAVDLSPAGDSHYRARFFFDPNSITMSSGSTHYILDGYNDYYTTVIFRLELMYENGSYKLRPRIMNDSWNYVTGSKYTISDDWHMLEIEWERASAPGANDGFFSLWVDDTLVGTIDNIDNDAVYNTLDEMRLGATSGVDSTTSGSMTLSAWSWMQLDNGDLSVSSQAAFRGAYGMQALINDNATLKVYNDSPNNEKHFSARFYLDPNSVNIQNGQRFEIFDANYWYFCLYLGKNNNTYELNLCGVEDDNSWFEGIPVTIQDEWNAIEVEWKASSSPTADDGYVKLYINDVLVSQMTGLNNDTQSVNDATLGVQGLPDGTTTNGIIYFDSYKSSHGEHIGLETAPASAPTPTLMPSETPTPTETLTPSPTPLANVPGGAYSNISLNLPAFLQIRSDYSPNLQANNVTTTITYTYDALHRITGASYSDGRNFSYTYDANGNTLIYSDQEVETSYQYDAANQLLTAEKGESLWYYIYDANGSLVEVLPNNTETSGAKRYAYNTAGYLTQVEAHNGSGWGVQAEMDYNGLGQRLGMDAAGVIAYYVMDGNRPLTATTGTDTTSYLYGLGAIGEETNAWSYGLTDGTNTQRQLTDATGEVTYSARYTPWGDTLDASGTGNLTFGYFGGLMDATTGLLYVGDGQYYDPSTGRFLTRNAKPNQSNPYLPFDPTGAMFGCDLQDISFASG
ncbi:MAG: hypothetical protein HYU84_00220, partial [Chloroflexi bacterium]|nr:hypothetical protein [Chloroflexota bacterium]